MQITSKQNPTVKYFAALADKKFRKEYSAFAVEGKKCVQEAIFAGFNLLKIVCTPKLADEYPEATVVSESVFSSLSAEKTPQGVIAAVALPENQPFSPKGSCILLDGLQDPKNVGAIIRTANAAGYDEIYLADCADLFSPKAVRASMGGIFYVKTYSGGRDEILSCLSGVKKICADLHGENIFTFTPPEKFCLCIGNEGNGLTEKVRSLADFTVKIPMRETCESLNAAVSAGIAMYALKSK